MQVAGSDYNRKTKHRKHMEIFYISAHYGFCKLRGVVISVLKSEQL